MFSKLQIGLAAVLIPCLLLLACSEVLDQKQATAPGEPSAIMPGSPAQTDTNCTDCFSPIDPDTTGIPVITYRGAIIYVDFPFNENPSLWRGADGSRTDGGTIYACGRWMNSHSGADYYARDFSRFDGTQNGKTVYSGIAGYVVKAGDCGGYGRCVVIWDPDRHVAVRYAHMAWECNVYVGQWIGMRTVIGHVSNTGCGGTPHLHMVAYENVSNGFNWLPSCCSSEAYCCGTYAWR